MTTVRQLQLIRIGLAAVLLLLVVDAVSKLSTALSNPAGTDVLSMLAAANQQRDGACLYCPATEVHYQLQLVHVDAASLPQYFLYLPVFAWIVRPIAGMSLTEAAAAVCAVQVVCLALATFTLMKRSPTAMARFGIAAVVLSLPANWDLRLIQWDGVLLLALAQCLESLDSDHDLRAGLWLSVMILKPQLVWLIPCFFIGRPRVILGMALGGLGLLAASAVVAGPASLGTFAQAVIQQRPVVATSAGLITLMSGLGTGIAFAGAGVVGASVTLMAIRHRQWLAAHSDVALAAGVLLSMLASPHLNLYDLVLVALPIAVVARRQPLAALWSALAISGFELIEDLLFTTPSGLAPRLHLSSWVAATLVLTLFGLAIPDRLRMPRTAD